MFFVAAGIAALVVLLPKWMLAIRTIVTFVAFALFVASRMESRRIVLAAAVFVWVSASAYFTRRLLGLRHRHNASLVGAISDLWLIAMLTLLTLPGYVVTGLLLISTASWLPRAGRRKSWLAGVFALLGGWLIIAAKLDLDLELRRWYLLGALAVGIGGSLFSSAEEVQQREDVHPE